MLIIKLYRVKELNLLASLSSASDLQPIMSQSETVTLPASITWSKIEEEINLLPDFTIENVIQYFVYQKRLMGLKKKIVKP